MDLMVWGVFSLIFADLRELGPPLGRRYWWLPLVAYAIPLACTARFLLPMEYGSRAFFRGFSLAANGPLVHIARVFDPGMTALVPYAIVATVFWGLLLSIVSLSAVRRCPFALHLGVGILWCGYGWLEIASMW